MPPGQVRQAVELYRGLVLIPGSVSERRDVPDEFKRNFATALLMAGLPSGTLEVLQSMHEADHLIAVKLRVAIQRWEQTLPFFRRWDWKLSRIEPPNCTVLIDFRPGEMGSGTDARPGHGTSEPDRPNLAA